jgi:hypothetical protein
MFYFDVAVFSFTMKIVCVFLNALIYYYVCFCVYILFLGLNEILHGLERETVPVFRIAMSTPVAKYEPKSEV